MTHDDDTPADSDDTDLVSEPITYRMLHAGMAALRRLNLENPDYENRKATVKAIYRVMRGAK